ncbi:hypothetical protein PPSIR1_21389 [Plesiocystis pacifica SIR-1]|uniref:Uncharacterized protein n=1 Tax=Plesiocystis pacifica SIR-1 TaxID=391625 RepID=A6G3L7_9BACT|nr:hypothetical protein [Plesiocystis pacifica]EDM79624.1 hypothetical protein PPSIR1_21389 [Plesiocystis pacifica SIR-1]
MLRELGYLTSAAGISEFQRDYNRIGSVPLVVSGEVDQDTALALAFAYEARAAFSSLRGRRSDSHA